MLRRLLLPLLSLALISFAHAAEPPRTELAVTPAWKGWSRPGRSTELDVRLSSMAATRASLEVAAGRSTVHAEVDLAPGRAVRLQVPVSALESVEIVASSSAAPAEPAVRRIVDLSLSESPLLATGLASAEPVQLEGFHTVAMTADDLPRNASAYASIDALIVDAPTLAALDPRQLGALLGHAAACGRIVVLNVDARVRRLLDGAGGCGGQALMSATSLPQAQAQLASSLNASLPAAMKLGGLGELARSGSMAWNQVAVALAVYFAVAVLVLLFFASLPMLLLAPAIASAAVVVLLQVAQPASQLVVWSEGDSGAPLARYQAWQRVPGHMRERTRIAIPPQLAPSVQACDRAQPMRFEFDPSRGQVAFAEFDTRLFRQVMLCYSGSFPMDRAPVAGASVDGAREVRNAGSKAWPEGTLLADGRAHDLPALGPGERTTVDAKTARPLRDATARTAMTRTRPDDVAALWTLELGGVVEVPTESRGWLLVTVPRP